MKHLLFSVVALALLIPVRSQAQPKPSELALVDMSEQPSQREIAAGEPASTERPYRVSVFGRVGGGGGSHGYGLGGEFGLRFRPTAPIGFQLSAGTYLGEWGALFFTVPVTGDFLVFFNSRGSFQPFIQLGGSVAYTARLRNDLDIADDYLHLAVHAGGGVEWRMGQRFAMSVAARFGIRQAIGNQRPEFTRRDGASTDTAFLATLHLGFHFYL